MTDLCQTDDPLRTFTGALNPKTRCRKTGKTIRISDGFCHGCVPWGASRQSKQPDEHRQKWHYCFMHGIGRISTDRGVCMAVQPEYADKAAWAATAQHIVALHNKSLDDCAVPLQQSNSAMGKA